VTYNSFQFSVFSKEERLDLKTENRKLKTAFHFFAGMRMPTALRCEP